ncbi:hypothetical protein PVK06_038785 [Gossypium arboreum]|uniref:Uncharacterized protein n=1 Tax=Gossypium arboreum TaxID=29729 RepID=A0ABR0N1L0_GOSAR|nr:hypothetical protein PVK06_038785 [Gossypium arboreum]
MRDSIMFVNEANWEAIGNWWTQPTVIVVDGTTRPKERSKYIDVERMTFHENSQALNSIFNGVDLDQLKVSYVCAYAKEAWTILKNQNEGNDIVRMSKL